MSLNKLRAIEYLAAVAEAGSFTAAGRKLGVSTPAIHKLLGTLESSVGVKLLHRDGKPVLTREGQAYLAAGRRAIEELTISEQELVDTRSMPTGELTIALSRTLGTLCIIPRLHEFHMRHPQISLDLILEGKKTNLVDIGADVLVCLGWYEQKDCIARQLAQSRFLVVASPSYLAKFGIPRHPDELQNHQCLALRLENETVLDVWEFEKNRERLSVTVRGWLTGSDRAWIIGTALAGGGIMRVPDLAVSHLVANGALVPILLDWTCREAPPIYVCYRKALRNQPRMRALLQFLSGVFRDIEASRLPLTPSEPQIEARPSWMHRKFGRRSTQRV
jgi:DNA-binding transcriptional LysR family regulator